MENMFTSMAVGTIVSFLIQRMKKNRGWGERKIIKVLTTTCLVIGFLIALGQEYIPVEIIKKWSQISVVGLGWAFTVYNIAKPFFPKIGKEK